MKVSQAVAIRIKEILIKKKMSQYRLEMNSGIPKGTLKCVMRAKYKGVNLTTLFVIIQTLDVSVNEFFDSNLFSEDNIDID